VLLIMPRMACNRECLSNSPQTPAGHLAGADDCAINARKLSALPPDAIEEEQCNEEKCARQQEWFERCCLLEGFIPKAEVRTRRSQNRPKPVLKQPNSKTRSLSSSRCSARFCGASSLPDSENDPVDLPE
jgi:hypothetical protein